MKVYAKGELGKQGSPEWHAIRSGKITASMASSIVTSKGEPSKSLEKYAKTLAAELWVGESLEDFGGTWATRRGNELEPDARADYAFAHNVDVVEVDFVVGDSGDTGHSPDGHVGPDGNVELKCLTTPVHIEALKYYAKHGRLDASYIAQASFQAFDGNRAWTDIYYYHPKLPRITWRVERSSRMDAAFEIQVAECVRQRDIELAVLQSLNINPVSEQAA